ncbi:MAG: hypothetical protein Q9163_003595 [Psora crenata]
MPEAFTLYSLLAREDEPTAFLYNEVTKSLTSHLEHPKQISNLAAEESQNEVLLYLVTRSHRLVKIFDTLRHFQTKAKPATMPQIAGNLATETTTFLIRIIIPLYEVLELKKLVLFLSSALSTCLTFNPPSHLRHLAGQFEACPKLFPALICDSVGGRRVQRWVESPVMALHDPKILRYWTNAAVQMVASCPGNHESLGVIQDWKTLEDTREALSEISMKLDSRAQEPLRDTRRGYFHTLPPSSDARKVNTTNIQPIAFHTDFPDLTDNLVVVQGLEQLGLSLPVSRRSLDNVLKALQVEKTKSILCSVAATFPCNFCKENLVLVQPIEQDISPVIDRGRPTHSDELLQFLGNVIGLWKVSVSAPALKNIRSYSNKADAVSQNLVELTSGTWTYKRIGSKQQQKALRVPLAATKCGQDIKILWQIDVQTDEQVQVPQQIITVWAVGDLPEIDKAINQVIKIQQIYTQEHVRRCRTRPVRSEDKLLPVRFTSRDMPTTDVSKRQARLDVTDVDQATIDMANKFFALTKPLIQAIIDNNLVAEFPFDLSTDEARIINNFETASLILGRSGTGKTTCLIFKMVSRYLARRALMDEPPIRQILLTRSSFLAEKLREYSRRLIEGRISQPLHLKSLQDGSFHPWTTSSESSTKQDALALKDEMFPLVCTFVELLQMLESTVK